ncbi:MAG TPA: glycosyltransferase family 2 protein [Thermomicrobiales bacterium]|nr:glycosyltransferase family 2 protein [Thermomicrobiales bacterium]
MARIAILVVAYNAEATLARVLDRVPPAIWEKVAEVIVFDDASQDRTYAVGRDYQRRAAPDKLTVFRNPVNLMYGGNQQQGYRYAIARGFDHVVLLHGDGQYAPEVMQRLLTPLESGAAAATMGSRMLDPGGALRGRMPRYKFVGNRVLTWAQNRLAGAAFSEWHSGYRAYAVAALRTIPLERLTAGWHFDTQIVLEFLRRGYPVAEVPIPTYYGEEICHVNGVPYAAHCLAETARFARERRRPGRAALPRASRLAK